MSDALAWERILSRLAAVFYAPSREIFARLAQAWVLCPGRRTVTRLYQLAEPEGKKAHDAYHRFLRAGAWSLAALWRQVALLLVATLCPQGKIPLDLDDTLFRKSVFPHLRRKWSLATREDGPSRTPSEASNNTWESRIPRPGGGRDRSGPPPYRLSSTP